MIGGSAAGASIAHELSKLASVALIERETAAGYHSTGRSAAVISEAYGPFGWQALVTASCPFFETPPRGFADRPLPHRIGALYLAAAGDEAELVASSHELSRRNVAHRLLPADEARARCPAVSVDDFSLALLEPGCADIDANALLQGHLKLERAQGLQVLLAREAMSLERHSGRWHLAASDARLTTHSVVNAAGAWADDLARRAVIQRKGLQLYRRTAITFDQPVGADVRTWPMTFDMAETWYFKPEASRVRVSPADRTTTALYDAAPEEFDVTVAIDRIERIERATTMTVPRMRSKWAGLRTFAADEQPVIGPDPDKPSFIWLAGRAATA